MSPVLRVPWDAGEHHCDTTSDLVDEVAIFTFQNVVGGVGRHDGDIGLGLGAALGALERATRLRYHWLLDSGAST